MKGAPKWAIKHKFRGTELRYIGGRYRLYRITSRWNPEKKRAQKITLEFLGTITEEEGLVKPKVQQLKDNLSNASVLEHGPHALVDKLNDDIRTKLQKCYPKLWQEIWIAAQMRFIHQSPIKNWSYYYERSTLSNTYPGVKLGPKRSTSVLKEVGSDRSKILSFLYGLCPNEKDYILIDTTHVTTKSNNIDFIKKGYNNALSFDSQINLLYIFSEEKKLPVYYRVLPGNVREISAMKLSIAESKLKNVVLVGDKGFYSKANIEALKDCKIDYILPLKRNYSLIDYNCIAKGDKSSMDGFFLFNNRAIWFSRISSEIILYQDEQLRVKESTDYLCRIKENNEGYSQEEYFRKQYRFGTLALSCNIPSLAPEDIYHRYKARGAIEQAFDSYKNILDADRTYMQGAEQMEAWSFINFLALVFYYNTYNSLLTAGLLEKFFVKDLLIRSRESKKILVLQDWKTSEISSKTLRIFTNIKAPIT